MRWPRLRLRTLMIAVLVAALAMASLRLTDGNDGTFAFVLVTASLRTFSLASRAERQGVDFTWKDCRESFAWNAYGFMIVFMAISVIRTLSWELFRI